ncbi:MAG: Transglycosylase-associated protein [Candidatus Amesbacteria bacterium GW2011_GWA2_42_12]|uniref:Transglycosylase-associated protein n=1 Tax=Candidatus Amesbacteria bacterium GW2011_GWA2_42_12 TaxID=1618356 RepID=A0A0G0Y7P3_9BACT|nr:MAG: Transglycosylase-associated protein [Candidatus Amesbacteria bacterium GW2011_GWA2_42_12]
MNILLWIILGAAAGWIADIVMASSHGLLEDIILGIIGAFVGGYVLNFFGQSGVTGFNFYSLIVAVIGAVVLIFLGRLLHK